MWVGSVAVVDVGYGGGRRSWEDVDDEKLLLAFGLEVDGLMAVAGATRYPLASDTLKDECPEGEDESIHFFRENPS